MIPTYSRIERTCDHCGSARCYSGHDLCDAAKADLGIAWSGKHDLLITAVVVAFLFGWLFAAVVS